LSNPFFQFKQFTVYQDKCAMKVCTDACLFGAWVAEEVISNKLKPISILDIGAGTGLLSLMLAQKLKCTVDAVEIERGDFLQCRDNFEQSAWSEQLNPFWTDIKKFQTGKQYNLIISNPPFFDNDLKSGSKEKNRAKHNLLLNLNELFIEADRLLSKEGYFALLLPHHRKDEGIKLAKVKGFFLSAICNVQQTPNHPPFRTMFLFQRKEIAYIETGIIIKEEDGQYSEAFTALLKDYYLYL
jgi:tRNA1Val (adenine37-N6)-methyltransferase